MTSLELARLVARFLDDKQARDLTVLGTADISSLSDYFVFASADSVTQIRGLSHGLEVMLRNYDQQLVGKESDKAHRWHLLDYGDVVIHIMHRQERSFYQLDSFWSHAEPLPPDEWQLKQAS